MAFATRRESMDTRNLRIIGGAVVVLIVLGIGVAAAGVLYREAREMDRSHNIVMVDPPVFSEQEKQVVDEDDGLIVTSVSPDSPAAEVGVVRGDILLKVDDQAVIRVSDVQRVLADLDAGDQLDLIVQHGDDVRTIVVTLGERNGKAYLGLSLCCGHRERMEPRFIVHRKQSPLIVEVLPDSPADEAGLKEGDLIVAINGEELGPRYNLREVIGRYEVGDKVEFEVWSAEEEESHQIMVNLGENPDKPGQAYLGVRYAPGFLFNFQTGEHLSHGRFQYIFPHFEEGRIRPLWLEEHDLFGKHLEWDWIFELPVDAYFHGIIIKEVIDNSPADEAGLHDGDVITALDGEPVESRDELVMAIRSRQPGEVVTLTVSRLEDGSEAEFEVELGGYPGKVGVGYLGVKLGALLHKDKFEGRDV
jgi:S1-C subfamily serine protease